MGIGALLAVVPGVAHHSFAAEFDDKAPVTLKGAVSKVEWANPHIYIYVDVKDASGKTVNWALEGGPPNSLFRQGWRKDTLKLGETITVEGFKAKDGSNMANMRTITRADGKRVFAGTSGDGTPGEN
jgi:Family of unknown function (DUF6152)